ncbi:MAG: ComEC/Rec2 family competence protein [Actinomycetaceae bacterium]|nr:ComEC/Rec2 family competence protein [Actinomycetaceae bacterium]
MSVNLRAVDLSLVAPALGTWGICLAALHGMSPLALVSLLLVLVWISSLLINQHVQRRPRHGQKQSGSAVLLTGVTAVILGIAALQAHLHYRHYTENDLSGSCLSRCELEVVLGRAATATKTGYSAPATIVSSGNQQLILQGKGLKSWKTNDRLWVRGQLKTGADAPNLGIFRVETLAVLETSFAHQVATQLELATSSTQSGALIKAMTLGDLSGLDTDTRAQIRAAGVSHLVAISGLHLAIILGMFHALLPGRPRHKIGATWLGMLLVLASVGWQPSIVRATTMLAITTVGTYLKRHSQGVNSLAAVILIWLIYDPWLARSIGFLLSVVATLAVLGVSISAQNLEHFEMERAGRKFWLAARPVLLVPVFAQLVTSLFTVSQLGTFATYGIFTNLLLSPVIPLITGGGVIILVTSLLSLQLATWVSYAVEVFAGLSLDLITFVAQLPGAFLEGAAAWWGLGVQYLLAGISFICWRGMRSYLHGS